VNLPSDGDGELGLFDRLADVVSRYTSRAWFFVACLLLIVGWACSFPLFPDAESWQLPINSATTIITFLLVSLNANTEARSQAALHKKLNAMADAQADTIEGAEERDAEELRAAVGLEERESSS
jgi:low affinity Fe/Cu permease